MAHLLISEKITNVNRSKEIINILILRVNWIPFYLVLILARETVQAFYKLSIPVNFEGERAPSNISGGLGRIKRREGFSLSVLFHFT